MLDTLTSLQSKVQPLQGLSNYKNGKKYYEVLVENATNSTDSISTIKRIHNPQSIRPLLNSKNYIKPIQ